MVNSDSYQHYSNEFEHDSGMLYSNRSKTTPAGGVVGASTPRHWPRTGFKAAKAVVRVPAYAFLVLLTTSHMHHKLSIESFNAISPPSGHVFGEVNAYSRIQSFR